MWQDPIHKLQVHDVNRSICITIIDLQRSIYKVAPELGRQQTLQTKPPYKSGHVCTFVTFLFVVITCRYNLISVQRIEIIKLLLHK